VTQVPEREEKRREPFNVRFVRGRSIVWSWLTDPAVLLYRREAHGRDRMRVLTVEFFLFVREVTREFYQIEGTNRAASLAYTTLLSLIPLLVAFTSSLQRWFCSVPSDDLHQITGRGGIRHRARSSGASRPTARRRTRRVRTRAR